MAHIICKHVRYQEHDALFGGMEDQGLPLVGGNRFLFSSRLKRNYVNLNTNLHKYKGMLLDLVSDLTTC